MLSTICQHPNLSELFICNPNPAHGLERLPATVLPCPWPHMPPQHYLTMPMAPYASPPLPDPAHGPVCLPTTPGPCPCPRMPPHRSLPLL